MAAVSSASLERLMSSFAPALPATAVEDTRESSEVFGVPWYLWVVAFASESIIVGVIWDISWHRSIGRDSFWTPAHLAIYLGGTLAGLSCGWLVLQTTFASLRRERALSVSFWGFRGPLGAWVCIWGAVAMIVSAPFDDWWHNAYGLDVKILSPPHSVLAAGIYGIGMGTMLMTLARQNGASSSDRSRLLPLLFVHAGGLMIVMVTTLFAEFIMAPNGHHSVLFFLVTAATLPVLLVGISRATRERWGATGASAVYMGLMLTMIWTLQLFPAQPMLAPILRQITHMVPPSFPLLLVVPALLIDLIVNRISSESSRVRAICLAALAGLFFIGGLGFVQWPFAEFLLSDNARNFFFAADQWDYNSPPGMFQYEFWGRQLTAGAASWISVIACFSAVVGLLWGNWMRRVRR